MRLGRGRATPRSFLIATAALAMVFGLGFWAMFLWTDYRRELNVAEGYGDGVLDALREHIRRLVGTNDVLLQQMLRMLAEDGVEPYRYNEAEWRKLRDLAGLPQQTSILTVLDRTGEVLVSTRGFGTATPKLSLAEHTFFEAHRAGEVDGLLIGPTSPIDGKPFLAFTRRWRDEDGTFLGVVAAARAPDKTGFGSALLERSLATISTVPSSSTSAGRAARRDDRTQDRCPDAPEPLESEATPAGAAAVNPESGGQDTTR